MCKRKNLPFRLPFIQSNSDHNGHIYYVILHKEINRKELLSRLENKNIQATSHFEPLHLSPAGFQFCKKFGELLTTEENAKQLVRLPIWHEMSDSAVRKVVDIMISTCEEVFPYLDQVKLKHEIV